jgi:hypothetical protein
MRCPDHDDPFECPDAIVALDSSASHSQGTLALGTSARSTGRRMPSGLSAGQSVRSAGPLLPQGKTMVSPVRATWTFPTSVVTGVGAHRRHAEAAGPHLPLRRHRVRDQPRRTDRLGRPRRWRRLLRPGPLRPRVPGVHRAHADPVRRSPAAVPARTSRPRAGRLAAAGRLISYKSDSSRHANLGAPQSKGEPRGQGGHVQLGVGGRLRRGRE